MESDRPANARRRGQAGRRKGKQRPLTRQYFLKVSDNTGASFVHHEEGGLCGTAGFKYSSKVEVQLLPLPSAPLRVCPTFSAPSNVFDLSTPASFSSPQPVSPHPPGAPGCSRASWYADRKPHSICHRGRRRKDAIETSPGQKRASDRRAYHLGASVPPRRRHGCADDPDSHWSVRPPRTRSDVVCW